jgi:PleD family two-component response regulator
VDRLTFAAAAARARRPALQTAFSAGLAQLRPDEGMDQALERTGLAMYHAKSQGARKDPR